MRLLALAASVLLCAIGLAGCGSAPTADDQDGDSVPDALERKGWNITVDLLGQRTSRLVLSDPAEEDTDGDGLPDAAELILGTDPSRSDTDADGLTDCEEAYHAVLADCVDPDRWDWLRANHDGGLGTDAHNADSDPGGGRYVSNHLKYRDETATMNLSWVHWGDGIPDGTELHGYDVTVAGQLVRVHTDPMKADSDGDGLDDGEEAFVFRVDPTVRDTDADGCLDGRDLFPDRAEKYSAGLRSFRLNTTSPAKVQFTFVFMGQILQVPANGSLAAAPGNHLDLEASDPGSFPAKGCEHVPYDPWTYVQVQAVDASADSPHTLDIGSHDGSSIASFWWNVRSGEWSWTHAGPDVPMAGDVVLAGSDGELRLLPSAA